MTERKTGHDEEASEKKAAIDASSLENFVELVEREGCKKVEAKPVYKIESRQVDLKDSGTAILDNYFFRTEYSSITSKGEKLRYSEFHTGGHFSTTEFQRGDPGSDLLKAINIARGVITANDRLRLIKKRLPEVDIEGPMTKRDYNDMVFAHAARIHNIEPFGVSNLEFFNMQKR